MGTRTVTTTVKDTLCEMELDKRHKRESFENRHTVFYTVEVGRAMINFMVTHNPENAALAHRIVNIRDGHVALDANLPTYHKRLASSGF